MESHLEEGTRRGGGWGRPRRRIDHDVAEDGEGAAIRHRERLADPLAGKVDASREGVAQGLEEGVGWGPLGCAGWVGHLDGPPGYLTLNVPKCNLDVGLLSKAGKYNKKEGGYDKLYPPDSYMDVALNFYAQ